MVSSSSSSFGVLHCARGVAAHCAPDPSVVIVVVNHFLVNSSKKMAEKSLKKSTKFFSPRHGQLETPTKDRDATDAKPPDPPDGRSKRRAATQRSVTRSDTRSDFDGEVSERQCREEMDFLTSGALSPSGQKGGKAVGEVLHLEGTSETTGSLFFINNTTPDRNQNVASAMLVKVVCEAQANTVLPKANQAKNAKRRAARKAPSPTADTAGVMNARPTSTATAITAPRVAARIDDGGGAALTSGGAKCHSDPPATTAITVPYFLFLLLCFGPAFGFSLISSLEVPPLLKWRGSPP